MSYKGLQVESISLGFFAVIVKLVTLSNIYKPKLRIYLDDWKWKFSCRRTLWFLLSFNMYHYREQLVDLTTKITKTTTIKNKNKNTKTTKQEKKTKQLTCPYVQIYFMILPGNCETYDVLS